MASGSTTVAASPRFDWRRALPWVLCALPVLIFAVQAWQHHWIADDGFINFRFVRQLEAGNGPVYNAGQRVEGFTSPGWLAVLTVVDLLTPLRLEWVAVCTSITFAVGGLALAIAGSARLWRVIEPEAAFVPLGALVPVALYPMWAFATSGLETGATFGWLGLCVFMLGAWARTPDEPLPAMTAVVLGLGWLIRPELLVVTLVLLASVIIGEHDRRPRRLLRLAAATFAFPIAYQLFRMGYYASLVANTAYAKQATAVHWSRGWQYFREFVGCYVLWLPALAIAILTFRKYVRAARSPATRRVALVAFAFLVGGALISAYVVRIGGDYIHARLLLPPLFAVCMPTAVVPIPRRVVSIGIVIAMVVWCVVSAVALRPAQQYRVTLDGRRNLVNVEDVIEAPVSRVKTLYRDGRVFWEDKRIPDAPNPALPRPTAARQFIGTTGFILGPKYDMFDTLGLTDALTARFATGSRVSIPGHEKPIPAAWAAARLTAPGARPSAATFSVQGFVPIAPLIPPETGTTFQRQVAAARHALTCGDLKAFHDRYTKPLSPERFLGNLWGSISSATLSIPADPRAAQRKFCTPGGR